jgi:hypothetical protein
MTHVSHNHNHRAYYIVGSRIATSMAAALINVGFVWIYLRSIDLVAVLA